jgi:hypothetical protein
MCASPFKLFRDGPPPPRVVLLPDALFFSRSLPVAPQAAGADSAADVGVQIELALEAVAPFPLPHLYYGYYWVPGSDHALAFASYRRRFTAEQTEAWGGAELVLPAFASVLGAALEPATTVVLPSPEGITAVHWGQGPVPSRVLFTPLAAEATEEERAKAREDLLRRFESKTVVELPGAPEPEAGARDGSIAFRSGQVLSRFTAAAAAALDVRDKTELAALRRARGRDLILWRVGVGCGAAFLLLLLGEMALFAGGLWQETRRVQYKAQAPTVDRIIANDEVAHRIEDLSTKRRLPLEMLSVMHLQKPSPDIVFLRTETSDSDIYTISVVAQTPNAAEIDVYRDKLQALPSCQSVTIKPGTSRQNFTEFTILMTFKPGTIQPGTWPTS